MDSTDKHAAAIPDLSRPGSSLRTSADPEEQSIQPVYGEDERKLIYSAKFAALDRPSGMSFMQAGAGLVLVLAVAYSAIRYFNKNNKVTSARKHG